MPRQVIPPDLPQVYFDAYFKIVVYCFTFQLTNLPEHILLDIMSYMSDSFLLFEAPKVCMEWKRLSRSPVLWSGFELVIDAEAWLAPGRAFFFPRFADQLG